MRAFLLAVGVFLAFHVLRTLLRWLLQTPPRLDGMSGAGSSEGEMVLDPECGVYVLRERALSRRIKGDVLYFCGAACAAAHAARIEAE